MNVKHLCIIDPGLVDSGGHHVEYARVIGEQMLARGGTYSVLAHKSVSSKLQRAVHAVPVFRRSFWERIVPMDRAEAVEVNTRELNQSFLEDIDGAFAGRDISDWLVFMPSIDHHQMLAWAYWLAGQPPERLREVVLLFRYSNYWETGTEVGTEADWARKGFQRLQPFAARGRARLVTESRRLARLYASLANYELEAWPLPLLPEVLSEQFQSAPGRPLRVATLGDARAEKGFALIVEAILSLAQHAAEVMQRIEFYLHSYISGPYHEPMRAVRERLAAAELPNVHLLDQHLDRSAYVQHLSEADIVLLPFDRRIYYARTSGTLTESLAAGKVIITTQDTWLSEQMDSYGAGLAIPDGDSGALARAIVEAEQRFEDLSRLAQQRHAGWATANAPDRFMTLLLGSHG